MYAVPAAVGVDVEVLMGVSDCSASSGRQGTASAAAAAVGCRCQPGNAEGSAGSAPLQAYLIGSRCTGRAGSRIMPSATALPWLTLPEC
jgi:hypothetical protein